MNPETYPGLEARKKGLKAHYPIVLIPGFVTTGLEVSKWRDMIIDRSIHRVVLLLACLSQVIGRHAPIDLIQ